MFGYRPSRFAVASAGSTGAALPSNRSSGAAVIRCGATSAHSAASRAMPPFAFLPTARMLFIPQRASDAATTRPYAKSPRLASTILARAGMRRGAMETLTARQNPTFVARIIRLLGKVAQAPLCVAPCCFPPTVSR